MTAGSVGTLIPAREALEDFSIRVIFEQDDRSITVAIFSHNPVFSSGALELPWRHKQKRRGRTILSAFCSEDELLLDLNFEDEDK